MRRMIASLTGTIHDSGTNYVVISVGGVGYRVATTKTAASFLALEQKPVTLLTHLAVREDALDLYGFLEKNERTMFELLLDVPGIGPKGAMSVLDIGDIPLLASAISRSDVGYLTGVSGIGKKTAEKIVIELREKVKPLASSAKTESGDADVFEALRTLGYSAGDIRNALKEIPPSATSMQSRLREALKFLSRGR